MSKKQIELMVCRMCNCRYTNHKENKPHQWTCSECENVRTEDGWEKNV